MLETLIYDFFQLEMQQKLKQDFLGTKKVPFDQSRKFCPISNLDVKRKSFEISTCFILE